MQQDFVSGMGKRGQDHLRTGLALDQGLRFRSLGGRSELNSPKLDRGVGQLHTPFRAVAEDLLHPADNSEFLLLAVHKMSNMDRPTGLEGMDQGDASSVLVDMDSEGVFLEMLAPSIRSRDVDGNLKEEAVASAELRHLPCHLLGRSARCDPSMLPRPHPCPFTQALIAV